VLCPLRANKPGIPKPGDKVLWIRFRAFGDVIQTAAGAYYFKKRFPDVHLTFLTQPQYADFLRALPYVNDVITGNKKPFAKWREVVQKIRAGRYQWIVNTHTGGSSSLLSFFSRAEYRIGSSVWYLPNSYHADLDSWGQLCGVDFNDRSRPSIFVPEEDRKVAISLLSNLPERKLFAVIGASSVKKMWAEENWNDFLCPLVNDGWGIVLNGHGPIEEGLGRKIESALASSNVLNLVGALDFKKMSSVVCGCTLAIGNDTGPLHLAALCGVPTLGIMNRVKDSALWLLKTPWFREISAADHFKEKTNPIKSLPAATVAKHFEVFAEEFLPKAFDWRDDCY